MDRNINFGKLDVAAVVLHLAWSSVQVITDDVSELQLSVSGSENEVNSLKTELQDGRLLIEQPAYGIASVNVMENHWMTIYLRIPADWKGTAELVSTSGRIELRGLCGSDLAVDTVSGTIRAENLQFLSATFKTISGRLSVSGIAGEKLSIRTVTGDVQANAVSSRQIKLTSVNSDLHIALADTFESVSANTVTGSLMLDAPIAGVKTQLFTVSGRQHLFGVSESEAAPAVIFRSVSGNLEITAVPANN